MKIVVNTRLLIEHKLEGIGRFSFETLQRIVKECKEHDFVFLFDRPFNKDFLFSDNVKGRVVGPKARHPLLYYYWFNHVVTRVLQEEKADLFLSMDGMLSLTTHVKQIPVIHDLNFEHYPEYLPYLTRKYYQHFFPKFSRKAERILTVSKYSKQDIVNTYGIDANKIDVTCNAASDVFEPVSSDEKKEIRQKYANGCDYFINVGSINPRKNIIGTLLAFNQFKDRQQTDVKMLVIGEVMWKSSGQKDFVSTLEHNDDIVFTGRVEDDLLSKLLASAIGLCYVSYFEGFGIPILEAMKAGIPVITSNVTSMPEVGGDAVLLVNPYDVSEISNALSELTVNKELRKQLIEKGFKREKHYTWENAANIIIESIHKCLVP